MSDNKTIQGQIDLRNAVVYAKRNPEMENLIREYLRDHPEVKDGSDALILAVSSTENLVKILLDAGFDPDFRDENGKTALITISSRVYGSKEKNMAKMLIKAGTDLNLRDDSGWTALMYASYWNEEGTALGFVELLLDSGANPNIQDTKGNTALMLVVSQAPNDPIIKLLIEANTDVYIKNKAGKTVFDKHKNLGYLLKCISEKEKKDEFKSVFSEKVLHNIQLGRSNFQLTPGQYGERIMLYNFLINSHSGDDNEFNKKIYEQIQNDDPDLLEYLNIRNADDLGKIQEYVSNL